jgi:hypothetical protein
MPKELVRFFPFKPLRLGDFLTAVETIVKEQLTPAVASALGLGRSYNELVVLTDEYIDVFKRNPSLLLTDSITETVNSLRRLMVLFKTTINAYKATEAGADIHLVDYAASPYLKKISGMHLSEVITYARELVSELQKPSMVSAVTALGLIPQLMTISQLAESAHQKWVERGMEKEDQKALGSATAVRRKVEPQLRFVLYSSLAAYYTDATDPALIAQFEAVGLAINGTLDSLRYLVETGSGSGSVDDDNGVNIPEPEYPEDPEDPSEGPQDPGGDTEDPAGGEDEGSGGPLD